MDEGCIRELEKLRRGVSKSGQDQPLIIEIVHSDGDVLAVMLRGDVAAYYRSFGDQSEARLNADLRRLAGLAAV